MVCACDAFVFSVNENPISFAGDGCYPSKPKRCDEASALRVCFIALFRFGAQAKRLYPAGAGSTRTFVFNSHVNRMLSNTFGRTKNSYCRKTA